MNERKRDKLEDEKREKEERKEEREAGRTWRSSSSFRAKSKEGKKRGE